MKKIITTFLILLFLTETAMADNTDKLSKEYLQTHSCFSITRPLVEYTVQRAIKNALKKSTNADFNVKFDGYNTQSIKKGIFKYIELDGNDVLINNNLIPHVHLKSLSDYNYIDYKKTPIEFLSDMTYNYDILLSEETINSALKNSKYSDVLKRVNDIASPFFSVSNVSTHISDSKLYIVTEYELPLSGKSKKRIFTAASDFTVTDGTIKAKNVTIDKAYGNIRLDKVANLINRLNPLEFTIQLIDQNIHNVKIENVDIVDKNIKVSGKIYIKANNKK